MPLELVGRILEQFPSPNAELTLKNRIGVALNVGSVFPTLMSRYPPPYLLDDYRMGIVRRGHLRGIINLKEVCLEAGTAVFITPGTIVEPIATSDDFLLDGMGLSDDQFILALGGHVPELFGGRMQNGYRMLLEKDQQIICDMLRLLRRLINAPHANSASTYNMVSSIAHYYAAMFQTTGEATQRHTRAHELFDRFLRLVNLNCKEQRQLSFYASKLCITDRYLSTLVHETSGVPAKEWIDRAVINTAKVMLRHSDKSVATISDELHFPTPSFFCKYFKRVTGTTPGDFRTKT